MTFYARQTLALVAFSLNVAAVTAQTPTAPSRATVSVHGSLASLVDALPAAAPGSTQVLQGPITFEEPLSVVVSSAPPEWGLPGMVYYDEVIAHQVTFRSPGPQINAPGLSLKSDWCLLTIFCENLENPVGYGNYMLAGLSSYPETNGGAVIVDFSQLDLAVYAFGANLGSTIAWASPCCIEYVVELQFEDGRGAIVQSRAANVTVYYGRFQADPALPRFITDEQVLFEGATQHFGEFLGISSDAAIRSLALYGFPILDSVIWSHARAGDIGNQSPNAVCTNVTVPAGVGGVAMASIDAGSNDPDDGDGITLSQAPPGPYAIGDTAVTLTVADNGGLTDSCTATVHVKGAVEQLADTIALVQSFDLRSNTTTMLLTNLRLTVSLLNDPRTARTACLTLQAFITLVNTQGRTMSVEQRAQLVSEVVRIRGVLGCS